MKTALLDLLICPACLPDEHPIHEIATRATPDDILEGILRCNACGTEYPIRDGIAYLDTQHPERGVENNRYETLSVLSSYLWSHFGDILKDEEASDAYRKWADLMNPCKGVCLDAGSAVGRFSFEMAQKCDYVVGIDNSFSFIRAARDLMLRRELSLALPQEGQLAEERTLSVPQDWRTDNIDFIVGDALALPFCSGAFSALSSLNIVDKVSNPIRHLHEINRTADKKDAQFLFSDPFSWSTEVANQADWLGGTAQGIFPGRGKDNVLALLEGRKDGFVPHWRVQDQGHVWWKIRTHSNHFELIRSQFIKAVR
ncbi:MAG: methyltransferase domain-containing protein [Desulfobacterales bacterium]|jgi:SAM-dependent methyltransferase